MLGAVLGGSNKAYRKEIGRRTRRGLEGRAPGHERGRSSLRLCTSVAVGQRSGYPQQRNLHRPRDLKPHAVAVIRCGLELAALCAEPAR
jgi:hypothetical protein